LSAVDRALDYIVDRKLEAIRVGITCEKDIANLESEIFAQFLDKRVDVRR
jgi:hypothetical protein